MLFSLTARELPLPEVLRCKHTQYGALKIVICRPKPPEKGDQVNSVLDFSMQVAAWVSAFWQRSGFLPGWVDIV